MMATHYPATGGEITKISTTTNVAVAKAREAFGQRLWSKQIPAEWKDTLIRLCTLMTKNRRELAFMESLYSGEPFRDCELIDIPEAACTIIWHARANYRNYDQTAPLGDGTLSVIVCEPIGVASMVLP